MEPLDIVPLFISTLEKSKHVKSKIDVTLELLYDYVTDDSKSKEPISKLDSSNLLELNELFSAVDRYLSEFQKYLVGHSVSGTCGNRINNTSVEEESVGSHLQTNCHGEDRNNYVDKVTVDNLCVENAVDNAKVRDEHTSEICVENPVNNQTKENNLENQNYQVDITQKESFQQASVKILDSEHIDENVSSSSLEPASAHSTTGTVSSNSKEGKFTIEKKAQMEIDGVYKVSVKHVNNLNDFYVHIMNDVTREFIKSWKAMDKFYKDQKNEKDYFIKNLARDCDIFVAVLYNSLWHRAKCLSRDRNSIVKLYLIDSGKCIKARIQKCRLLRSSFDFPIILQNVYLNIDFSPHRQTVFNALVGDAEDDLLFQVKCVGIVEGKFHVIMQELRSMNVVINEIISATPTSEDSALESNGQTIFEDTSKTWREEILPESFDPMKEAFYSETNDYKINPDNPCQAVMGYIPNDDRRYCKFGERCRKKACPRLHQDRDPNGWTKDEVECVSRTYVMAELPVNKLIKVTVSYVVDIGEFYAQIEQHYSEDEETLESLMEYMNENERMVKMQKLQTPPAPGEIVLASYKGYFYRGKVLLYNSETNLCVVFFVDFGSCQDIHLKNLRQMEGKYNHLPFQAFHFSIGHSLEFKIPKSSDHYVPMLHLFRNLVLYKPLYCVAQSYTKEPCDVFLFTNEKDPANLGEYFDMCCQRILESKSDTETTSDSTRNSSSVNAASEFNVENVAFLPG